jgi:hypothetical protein
MMRTLSHVATSALAAVAGRGPTLQALQDALKGLFDIKTASGIGIVFLACWFSKGPKQKADPDTPRRMSSLDATSYNTGVDKMQLANGRLTTCAVAAFWFYDYVGEVAPSLLLPRVDKYGAVGVGSFALAALFFTNRRRSGWFRDSSKGQTDNWSRKCATDTPTLEFTTLPSKKVRTRTETMSTAASSSSLSSADSADSDSAESSDEALVQVIADVIADAASCRSLLG